MDQIIDTSVDGNGYIGVRGRQVRENHQSICQEDTGGKGNNTESLDNSAQDETCTAKSNRII